MKLGARQVREGDIIMADTAEDETAGKVTEAYNVGDKVILSGQHTYLMRSKIQFAPKYLGYFLNSNCYHNQLLQYMAGTKVTSVSKNGVNKTYVIFPPTIDEQKRIAEALQNIDSLIEALDEQIAKKQAIKTGAMQQLLTAKTRLQGFTQPWVEVTFEDVVSRFATGLNPRQNFVLNSGGTLNYITIKDFKDGVLSFDSCDKIDQAAFDLIQRRADIRKGDLLFSSIGRVGDAYVISEDPKNWNINESVFALRPNKARMTSEFLYYIIKGNEVYNKLQDAITGSTLRSIKMNHLKKIAFTIPSDIAEQRAIAEVLYNMDAEIQTLQDERNKYALIKQGMMQELLTGKIRI